MSIFTFFSRKSSELSINEVIRRLEAVYETASGIAVTPENCEESPTVQAIVSAISMHMATLPVHVMQRTVSNGREKKQALPDHPVARLLARPNSWQTSTSYWLDATSTLVRYGNFVALKGRGITGPIRKLYPIPPPNFRLEQDNEFNVTAKLIEPGGRQRDIDLSEVHYVRNRSSDFLSGDSPVMRARDAIALEIAAQKFGSEFFGNGAMPGLVFKYGEGYRGHRSKESQDIFLESVQNAFGKSKRFRAMLLPQGIAEAALLKVENDKAQFLETRKLQRNVIAGVFGVPPHLVGDLERGTFSNIEHQSQEFINKVILPYVRMFESAMEKDLLTDEDRRSGVVIRFNLDANLRADFASRQKGLEIQRLNGVISPNDWRERENMNPISAEDGGDTYWQQGPSGQNADPDKQEPGSKPDQASEESDEN